MRWAPEREARIVGLTRDFDRDDEVPYFFWDRDVTVSQLRAVLAHSGAPRRLELMAHLLREARTDEVWAFVSPQDVAAEWSELAPRLGRRRPFWAWLLEEWRALGLLAR